MQMNSTSFANTCVPTGSSSRGCRPRRQKPASSGECLIRALARWSQTATFFPRHRVRESKAQLNGTKYVSATGSEILNQGEIDITHVGDNGEKCQWTIPNAKINCPILSVRHFTAKDCKVLFRKGGGVIAYPDGRRVPFVERLGVFFDAMNVLDPADVEHINKCMGKNMAAKNDGQDFPRPGTGA